MNSISQLQQQLQTGSIKTVTVDIFDTVLLRKIWPEGRQFLRAAKQSLNIFRSEIHPDITAYEIYSWREYIRREVLTAKAQALDARNDEDLDLEEWFSRLYTALYAKRNGKTKVAPKEFVHKLIGIELEIEKNHTQVNRRLVDVLRKAKQANPQLKVFFLSDMYLTAVQVEALLEHHNILDLFSGGTTSGDVGNAKQSGRLFYYVHNDNSVFADIDLAHNLHVGDNVHSDVRMAKSAGSEALFYYHARIRRLRTYMGRVLLRLAKQAARTHEGRVYNRALIQAYPRKKTDHRYFHDLGFLFSQPMAAYLLHVGLMSEYISEKRYLFVSSEAETFIVAGKKLYGALYNTPDSAVKLNRKRTINAVAWTIIQQKDESLMPRLVKTVRYGEVSDNRKELYDLLLTPDFPVRTAEINSLRQKEFYAKLYQDLQAASKRYTAHLESDYNYVRSTLPKDGRTVVICDVGWGGTVQAAYTLFAQLHDYKGKIEGLYLGAHPPTRFGLGELPAVGYLLSNVLDRRQRPYWSAVIWEYVYTNKIQFTGDEIRLSHVGEGLHHGYDYFRTIGLNPVEHFEYVVKPRIKRLLRYPTTAEVRALGEIRYDFGFSDPKILRIVDTGYPRWKFWLKLALKPKAAISQIVAPNNWTGGYIKYFRLVGMPALLKVIGRVRHTTYL